METHITLKGQIVIPAAVRKKLGIKRRTRIQIMLDEKNRRIILTPITREYIHSLRGKYKGNGVFKSFLEGKQREREM